MNRFEVIASSGHCGTMWLSRALQAGTDTRWYHELRLKICGGWLNTLRYDPGDPFFAPYWKRIRAELAVGDMGDANSWLPVLLPEVNKVQRIDRVIYLTRNPIQQLHSLATKSYVWRQDRWPEEAHGYLFQLSPLMTRYVNFHEWAHQWLEMSRWEKLCLLVVANDYLPRWLRGQLLPVEVYSLEALTTDTDALMTLAPNLSRAEAEQWQQQDINRKVQGDRSPEAIWAQWTPEQRAGFERIVGTPALEAAT